MPGLEQAETQDLVQNESQVQDQNQEQAQIENGQESGTSLDAMIVQWNEELDADTVTNLTDEEQVAVRTLFANTIFFGDSMTQAIGEYGFLDMTNIVYQRSATIDVLITKIPEVAATLPKQVVIFTGLNDCNHYTEIADYRRDYVTMLQQLKASIPGVKIIVSSLLSPSDALGQVRADLVRHHSLIRNLGASVRKMMLHMWTALGLCCQKNYLDDGIHMNRTFYRVWFRYLKALLGNQ